MLQKVALERTNFVKIASVTATFYLNQEINFYPLLSTFIRHFG